MSHFTYGEQLGASAATDASMRLYQQVRAAAFNVEQLAPKLVREMRAALPYIQKGQPYPNLPMARALYNQLKTAMDSMP